MAAPWLCGFVVVMVTMAICVSETNGQTGPCDIACDPLPNAPQVCGSDGVTYPSGCDLAVEMQCRNPDLYKVYEGPCVQTTTPCATEACIRVYDPVCGTDGRTYDNECILQGETCSNPSLDVAYPGRCRCDTICPAYNSPVCGSDGVTYDTICILNVAICRNPNLYKKHDGPCCEKPCYEIYAPICGSDGVTYENDCYFEIAQCKIPYLYKKRNGHCCEKGCNKIRAPICGSDGVTYDNDCYFEIAQCKNPYLKRKHDGECSVRGGKCFRYCDEHHQPVCGTNGKEWREYRNYCLFEIDQCRHGMRIMKFSACSSGVRTMFSSLFALVTLLASLHLV